LCAASALAAWPDVPPPLPPPPGRIVNVSTVEELNAAVSGLTSGTTVLIAPGTYELTRTLAVHGPLEGAAIRGASDNRADVVLVGAGRDNPAISHGIWVGGEVRRLKIASLTIRDVYYHAIALNPGPQAPHIYNVHLRDSGEQLLKTNPNADGTGIDNGVIEYSVFEYVPRSRNWYANAIQVLAGRNWVIRHNLIRGIRAPDGEMAKWPAPPCSPGSRPPAPLSRPTRS
jgi:pectate lyase